MAVQLSFLFYRHAKKIKKDHRKSQWLELTTGNEKVAFIQNSRH
jgi:hypothetical protein